MRKLLLPLAFALLSLDFCSGCSKPSPYASRDAGVKDEAAKPAMQDGNIAGEPGAGGKQAEKAAATGRKLIFTAHAQVTVEDFASATAKLEQLVKDNKGYIARQEVHGTPGSPRSGTWTVRVPIEHFDTFRAAIKQFGELSNSRIESREVTEEYVDLTARLDTKTKTKRRLEQHLENKTAKLEEVIKVEEQLDRVDGELEQIKGRMRLLDDLVSLTTVTVALQERSKFVPEEAPSYGTTVSRTFQNSLHLLVEFGQTLLLIIVGAAPWLVILALAGLPIWVFAGRQLRRGPREVIPVDPTRQNPQ